MSANDSARAQDCRLADLPTFDLCYGVDDVDAPATVTVYPESVDDIETHWITIDAGHAVDLVDVA